MKIGDTIRRKDMPTIKVVILGEHPEWPAWSVSTIGRHPKGSMLKNGMVFKDDDRWEVVNQSTITAMCLEGRHGLCLGYYGDTKANHSCECPCHEAGRQGGVHD